MSLPSITQIAHSPPEAQGLALYQALSTLFESSPIVTEVLVPALTPLFTTKLAPESYDSLIDSAIDTITFWEPSRQAEFIKGHPRIGEVKNLSILSAREQARFATAPEVIRRLEHLNNAYEKKYPGLIYITFVNGRSRAEIADEMETFLGVDTEKLESVEVGGDEWMKELHRAVVDVGLIAKSRLRALNTVM